MQSVRVRSVIFLSLVVQHAVLGADYCDVRCANGQPHVGCTDGKPDESCVNFKQYNLPTAAINLILNLHNTKRNRIALGQETLGKDGKLQPATNMHELKWSYEFANLSLYNVMQCKLAHDNCRGTDQFPYAGQNLGFYRTNDPYVHRNMPKILIQLINDWYNEIRIVPNTILRSYHRMPDGLNRGHFTQMIWAQATEIGCAVGTYGTIGRDFTILLCCDYSEGNINSRPVYEAGPPRSNCPRGHSRKFPGLCGNSEYMTVHKYVPQAKPPPPSPAQPQSDDYVEDDVKELKKDLKEGDGMVKDLPEQIENYEEEELTKKVESVVTSRPGNAAPVNGNSLFSILMFLFVLFRRCII